MTDDPGAAAITAAARGLVSLWETRDEIHLPGWGEPFRPLGELLPPRDAEWAEHNPQMIPTLWYPALAHETRRGRVIDVFDHLPAETGLSLPTRQALSRLYSWGLASRTTCEWIADCLAGRPLLEVGAGAGYWARLLRLCGVDVRATDAQAQVEHNGWTGHYRWSEVTPADAVESAASAPDHALALIWPPPGDPMAVQALRAYQGPAVLYIGDSPGGLCATPAFFTELKTRWRPASHSPLTLRWLGNHDRATHYVRRETAGRAVAAEPSPPLSAQSTTRASAKPS